jgi:hypothetical protein
MSKVKNDKIVDLVEEIAIEFYLWMQKNGYDHNIKSRVEERFTEYMKERYKNMVNGEITENIDI